MDIDLKLEDDFTAKDTKGTPFETLLQLQLQRSSSIYQKGKDTRCVFRAVAYSPSPDYEFSMDHEDLTDDLHFTMLDKDDDESIQGEDAVEFFKRVNGEGLEVGLTSQVKIGGDHHTLGMIDFKPGLVGLGEIGLKRTSDTYTSLNLSYGGWNFYATGNSAHAYSLYARPEDLTEYMARLLLLQSKTGEALVDTRWVAHALGRGYATLRLTCNNKLKPGHMYNVADDMPKRYLQRPTSIVSPFNGKVGGFTEVEPAVF